MMNIIFNLSTLFLFARSVLRNFLRDSYLRDFYQVHNLQLFL